MADQIHRHIHLDTVGGIAGDMFAGALLDLAPASWDGLVPALRRAGLRDDVIVRLDDVRDEVLRGRHFAVDDPKEKGALQRGHHGVFLPSSPAGHAHVPFADVRARIDKSGLPAGVIARAQDIFVLLARAEADVHGIGDVDAVVFHEVGAMDSVADIVAAAWLIEAVAASTWSTSPLPLGAGTVMTAHGLLPLPSPATAKLMEGFAVVDDGKSGERCTPTGVAILKHLGATSTRPMGTMARTGVGWGTKRFPGIPNIVRAVEIVVDTAAARERVAVISFEIDDQSGEDLAKGLDRIRAIEGVVDVVQAPVFGKKGRMASAVRALCRPDVEDAVVTACLTETTTLGVRIERVERVVLAREEHVVDGVRTKTVLRPDGTTTTKADIDDVDAPGFSRRAHKRRRAEER